MVLFNYTQYVTNTAIRCYGDDDDVPYPEVPDTVPDPRD
ncbi:MAG: hypothetical protein GFH27_549283n393 [Chloroflexi bacterium AL-W]|nr:hypothetical protein [Chloroflexi bacterium AL-N1]NOK64485.1 hypothetical protein [Chloroflexi bacterium AL-N10]NOK75727.1 hypothetical protein [Chloroflexi bacterium AL-N5]NOK80514.1 hypothetical protein [Chloroflexi bacterium AL-W]NOK87028.1 hypothetical protein [Chloroflexi bacterium AL-N15]